MTEYEKIVFLSSDFTIRTYYSTKMGKMVVKLSNCREFAASTLDKALDKCLLSILKESYKNDNDVKENNSKG